MICVGIALVSIFGALVAGCIGRLLCRALNSDMRGKQHGRGWQTVSQINWGGITDYGLVHRPQGTRKGHGKLPIQNDP